MKCVVIENFEGKILDLNIVSVISTSSFNCRSLVFLFDITIMIIVIIPIRIIKFMWIFSWCKTKNPSLKTVEIRRFGGKGHHLSVLNLWLFLPFTKLVPWTANKLETSGGVIWMGPWDYSDCTRFEENASLNSGSYCTNTKITS